MCHHLTPGRHIRMIKHMWTRSELILYVFLFDCGHVRCGRGDNHFAVSLGRAGTVMNSRWFWHFCLFTTTV